MPLPIENVTRVLNHQPVEALPRGELFLGRDFLDDFCSLYRGLYLKQLAIAAQRLGISVIGVELDPEKSPSPGDERDYRDLESTFGVGCLNGPIANLIARQGFVKAMVSTKKSPSLFSGIATTLLKVTERMARLAKGYGFQALAITDDIAGNQGLFFSLTYFENEVWPVYKAMAEIIKGSGLFVFFHSDGDIRKIIDLLIQAGVDCLHPIDTLAGLNPYDLKREFGERVSFMGSIDLMSWSPERVRQEVRLAEMEFQKGGLILGSTCGLSLETIHENFKNLYPHWDYSGVLI